MKKCILFSLQLIVASIISHKAIIIEIMNKWGNVYPKVAQILEKEVREGKGTQ